MNARSPGNSERWKGNTPPDATTSGYACRGCGRVAVPLNRQRRRAAGLRAGDRPIGIDHAPTCRLRAGGAW